MRTCPSHRVGCLAGRLQDGPSGGDEPEATSPCGIQTPCEIQTPCGMQTPLMQTPVAEVFSQYQWQSLEAMQPSDSFCQDLGIHHFHHHHLADVQCLDFAGHSQPLVTVLDSALPSVTDLRLADLLDVDGHLGGSPPAATTVLSPAVEIAAQCDYAMTPAMMGLSNSMCMTPSPERTAWYSASQPTWSSAPYVPPPPVVPPPPPGPALGSPELPSIGSAAHGKGSCRPCAFLHTKGCENGLACTFCHLCEPGERKRRQKEKLQQRRAAQQARLTSKAERAA